jgi:hypothetical protein
MGLVIHKLNVKRMTLHGTILNEYLIDIMIKKCSTHAQKITRGGYTNHLVASKLAQMPFRKKNY